ncbi:hypothetical protein [Sinomonas humi]|uniref:Lipoprotein n=1 Tax=Sinomonas humi TaxID=1338436 RepID=A0A0B2AHF6_9MICC|nr:hypothetical protein [Sinomonas humi]KHL02957.1 hypothetical protein LK10_11265 [Sinomonas humi]
MKRLVCGAVAGAALFAVTACGGTSQAASTTSSPSASPSPTPTPTASTSTTTQVASAIYSARQSFMKAASDWDSNECVSILSAGDKGLTPGLCVADLSIMNSTGQTIVLQLDGVKPWPSELSDLATSTRTYVNQAAGLANTTDYSTTNMYTFNTALTLAENKLESWTPYMGS